AGVAALAAMAGARGRLADARDPQRLAALAAMDEALARYDVPAAVQAWRQARELGLRTRGWRGPAEAADAELRLAAVIERVDEAKRNARELWLVALFRARAEGAVDGALNAAEGFARLGDRDAGALVFMASIASTVTETIQWVFPEHAGAPGQIHGGRMMQWITQAGTMAASRVAKGTVLLGAMDDIDFLHPVKVGQIAILRA